MEIFMVVTLALMGVYFFKSTDLPKDMRDRSAQFQAESNQRTSSSSSLRMTLPDQNTIKTVALDKNLDAKLAEMKRQKKAKEIQALNVEIDQLTLTIIALEQEIKGNEERNLEIQKTIDSHLLSLQLLQEQVSLLS